MPVRHDLNSKIVKSRIYKMRYNIINSVKKNSFDYFEKTLINDNGFREYDRLCRSECAYYCRRSGTHETAITPIIT